MTRAHRIRTLRRASVAACCAAAVFLGAMPTAAVASPAASVASQPSSPSRAGHFAPYPGGVSPQAESSNISAGGCTYRQAVDDPHPSSGETSVHGWWIKVSGSCPDKSDVSVDLQAYFCDSFSCYWVTVGSGSGRYAPGGGSGSRATARKTCSNSSTVGWRGVVDVDLPGIIDPSGTTTGTVQNLACSP